MEVFLDEYRNNRFKDLLLYFVPECVAVNITRLEVPSLVTMGMESVTLDCEYSTGEVPPGPGLVMKWFFNGPSSLVYQWIPPMRPQVIGLLKGKVDPHFRISGKLHGSLPLYCTPLLVKIKGYIALITVARGGRTFSCRSSTRWTYTKTI